MVNLVAQDVQEILPGLYRWEAFSSEHKVELTSHAVLIRDELYCFDPIPLAGEGARRLTTKGSPRAIVLTNGNHERASMEWSQMWQVPVWAAAESGLSCPALRTLPSAPAAWDNNWEVFPLPGGAPGETAFGCPELSLWIVGDAIVNLPHRGLEVLPAKYCVNRSLLEANLRQFAARSFQRLCVAHGRPLLHEASEAIRKLLS